MTDEAEGATITFVAPDDWTTLDLEPATSAASIRAYCDSVFAGAEEARVVRAEVEARLRQVAAQSRDIGALSVMFFVDWIDEEPHLLTASVVLSVIDTGADRVSVVELEQQLAKRGETLDSLDLPVGAALRASGRHFESLPEIDEEVEMYYARYFVPRPDDGGILVLAFSTPTLPLQQEFSDLFEAIAETLAFEAALAS